MKLIVLVGVLLIGSCSKKREFTQSSYRNNTEHSKKECDMYNPYSSGGHYAGYEWAERKNVSSCGGKSQSFINGCEKYLEQKENCE